MIRAFFAHLALLSIIILGVIFLFSAYAKPLAFGIISNAYTANIITAAICFLVTGPFMWALMTRKFQTQAFANLWANKRYRAPLIFFRVVRGALAIFYIWIYLLSFFSFYIALAGLILLVCVALIFTKKVHAFYIKLETRFFNNYHDRERYEAAKNRVELAPWDAHIAQFTLPVGTPVTGMTLEEMALRERFGVNIAMIRRGEQYIINAPGRNEKVYPGDVLFVIGTDDQFEQFKRHIEPVDDGITTQRMEDGDNVVLKKIIVKRDSFLYKRTIRESGIREKTNGLVVGIERNNRRNLNPESNVILEADDVLWVVGDARLIEKAMSGEG